MCDDTAAEQPSQPSQPSQPESRGGQGQLLHPDPGPDLERPRRQDDGHQDDNATDPQLADTAAEVVHLERVAEEEETGELQLQLQAEPAQSSDDDEAAVVGKQEQQEVAGGQRGRTGGRGVVLLPWRLGWRRCLPISGRHPVDAGLARAWAHPDLGCSGVYRKGDVLGLLQGC